MDAETRRAALRHLADVEAAVAVARSRVITAEEHSKRYRAEAFRTVRQMVQATVNQSRTRTVIQVRLAKAVAGLPWLAEAMLAGQVGIDQADEIALLFANPACRQVLDSLAAILVEQAQRLWFDGFRILCRHVRHLADPDGSAADHETSWRNRRVTSTVVADGWQARVFGDGLSAAEFDTLLELYTQIEFDRDWATARTEHGDQTCAKVLARTHQQRRFDALMAIIHTAAHHTPQLRRQPLTNIIVDRQTAEDVATHACQGAAPPVDVATELLNRRCHTNTGQPVSRDQLLQALLHGSVRGVIVDAHQRPIQASTTRRFFTGALRDLARLGDPHCTNAACDIHPIITETDHSQPFSEGGPTDSANAAIKCRYHNQAKQRLHLTDTRDHHGQTHTHHPNGTEIAPRTNAPRWQRQPPTNPPDTNPPLIKPPGNRPQGTAPPPTTGPDPP